MLYSIRRRLELARSGKFSRFWLYTGLRIRYIAQEHVESRDESTGTTQRNCPCSAVTVG